LANAEKALQERANDPAGGKAEKQAAAAKAPTALADEKSADLRRQREQLERAETTKAAGGGAGAGEGGGVDPRAVDKVLAGDNARAKKAAPPSTPAAPPAPIANAPVPAQPAKPAAAAPAGPQAGTNTLVFRTRDPQKLIAELKQIVEASGAKWEIAAVHEKRDALKEVDVAKAAKNEKEDKDTLIGKEKTENYSAVTSADRRDALLAKLKGYEVAMQQNGQEAWKLAEQKKRANVKEEEAAVKKLEVADAKADQQQLAAGAKDDASRAAAKPSAGVNPPPPPTATAAPGENAAGQAGNVSITIRIEILPE
jgi:hypothetical protein